MNVEYLRAFWKLAATLLYSISASQELLSPDFEAMSPEHRDQVIAAYDKLLQSNPDDVYILFLRGNALMAGQEVDRALSDLNAVVRLAPNSAQGYAVRARIWQALPYVEKALADWDDAIRLAPSRAQYYRDRGRLLSEMRQFARALDDFDVAIHLDPRNAYGFVLRGCLLGENGDAELALADFDEALRLRPHYARAHFNRGKVWRMKQEYDRAIEDYDAAIAAQPDVADYYIDRACLWLAKGEFDRVIADYTEVIRLNPDDAKAYFDRGMSWAEKHKYHRAINDLSEAINLTANEVQTVRTRLIEHAAQEEFIEALADFDQAAKLEANRFNYYARRGWLWHAMGDFGHAIADYDEALQRRPQDAWTHWCRSTALSQKGDYGRALLDAVVADQLDPRLIPQGGLKQYGAYAKHQIDVNLRQPNDEADETGEAACFATTYCDRALALQLLGRDREAIDDLNVAIQIDPTLALAFALRGHIWLTRHEFDKAAEDLDAAIRLDPHLTLAWRWRGELRMEQQEWAAACRDFSEALRLEPGQKQVIAQRGLAWQALQEWQHAIADYNQVTMGEPLYVRRVPRSNHFPAVSSGPQPPNEYGAPSTEDRKNDDYLESLRAVLGGVDNRDPSSGTVRGKQASLFETVGATDIDVSERVFEVGTSADDDPFRSDDNDAGANFRNQLGENFLEFAQRQNLLARVGEAPHNTVELDPIYIDSFLHQAECCEAQQQWSDAIANYQKTIHLAPREVLAHRRLAWLRATCSDETICCGEDAVVHAHQAADESDATEIEPLVVLAAAYAQIGDFESAIQYESAARERVIESCQGEVRDRETEIESLEFSWSVNKTDGNSRVGDSQAIAAATEACHQSAWQDVQLIDKLVNAYADAGQFDHAVNSLKKSLAPRIAAKEKPFVERLELYRAGKPYRGGGR